MQDKINAEEIFSVVDENGNVIGKEKRSVCHNGSMILHPVVHIHIINSKKRLLLQKRRMDKDIQPGKWDTSIGGHIQYGESIEEAVLRESREEAGINVEIGKLKFLEKYVFQSEIERELSYSYVYFYDGKIVFQESEIETVNFFNYEELKQLIRGGKTTPNFNKEFELLERNKVF